MYPLQHGFRKYRSCETQLDDVRKNIENSTPNRYINHEFFKSHTVRHYLLLHKLNHYEIQRKQINGQVV